MSAPDWQAGNDAYLAAALAWLRSALAGTGGPDTDQPELAWLRAPECAAMADPPALEILGDHLGLSRFERLLLLFCAAMELDPAMSARCAEASGDPTAPWPTFALALSKLPQPAWDVVSPHRPLRYWRLVEIHQPPGRPLIMSGLRADPRIVSYLKGLNQLDDRLEDLLRPVGDILGDGLPPSHELAVASAAAGLDTRAAGRCPIVELIGADPVVLRGVAAAAAARLGLDLYALSGGWLGSRPADSGDLLRLWERETLLLPLALYVEAMSQDGAETASFAADLADLGGVVFVGCREPLPVPGRALNLVDARKPTAAEQEDLWVAALGPQAAAGAARLAAQFDLNQIAIRAAASRSDHSPDFPQVWQACRDQARPRLDTLAQRVEPVATWDDLVLPAESMRLLRHLIDQVRGQPTALRKWRFAERITRGTGIASLFAGPPGTGKTLAAEVIAGELGLVLYRVDLSGVISKYIGETERNLRRVFDAADEGGTLLLFDEADALFGKRSEVRDSHDRYANIEVSYLLQRMEDYRGVAILATNQRTALDQAFLRRLRFVVSFPHPSPAERAALWQRAFPVPTPTLGLDIDRLAQLTATGGMIRNIALNAACSAAGRGGSVTMSLILEMARVEFRKLELPVGDQEFRWLEKAAP